MKPVGTKVCFDYIWKPGDSRGWDRGWDRGQGCLPSTGSLFCTHTNPPRGWGAPSVPACPIQGYRPQIMKEEPTRAGAAGGPQMVSNGSCLHTSPAATQADFWQGGCFRCQHGDLIDTTQRTSHWGQAYVCLKRQACICFLLREAWHQVWGWRCVWQVRGVPWNTVPPLLRHCQIFFPWLWHLKVQKGWPSFLINQSMQPSLSHCRLIDTWWRIPVLFLKSIKNIT